MNKLALALTFWLLGCPANPEPLKGSIETMVNQESYELNVDDGFPVGTPYPVTVTQYLSPLSARSTFANHGEVPVGVLGAQVQYPASVILMVLPGSDLNRFGVTPGDRILSIDGRRSNSMSNFRGLPGSVMVLSILHGGLIYDLPVRRVDSREFLNYDGYYRGCASQTRSW